MKQFVKSIIMISATLAAFTTSASGILHISKNVEEFKSCQSDNLVDLSSLEKSIGTTKPIIAVLNSDRYCINSFKKNRTVTNKDLIARDKLFALKQRYNKAIKGLRSDSKKLAFMDLFLQKASREFYITNTISVEQEKISIAFVRSTKTGRVVGDTFYLFPEKKFSDDVFLIYQGIVNDNIEANKTIIELVDYVMFDSEYTYKESRKSPEPASFFFKNKSFEIITSNSLVWGDDDDEPIGDPNGEGPPRTDLPYGCLPYDLDCIDEGRDEEYEEWAEEQAANWGEEVGGFWDFGWSWDAEHGERYLIVHNSSLDVFHAYHYNPRSERFRQEP